MAPASGSCSGAKTCAIELQFSRTGNSVEALESVEGRLTPSRPNASFTFTVREPGRLQWSFLGPAVHMVLNQPDGEVIGPGLPTDLPLRDVGRYVVSLSANTMADDCYGPFKLVLRLRPLP